MNADIHKSLKSIENGVPMTGDIRKPQDLPPNSSPRMKEIILPFTNEKKTKENPAFSWEYFSGGTVRPERKESYCFRIVFVYPKGHAPFVVKGGNYDVTKFLKEYEHPYVAHVTSYRTIHRKKVKTFSIQIEGLKKNYLTLSKRSRPPIPSQRTVEHLFPKHEKWVLAEGGFMPSKIVAVFRQPPRAWIKQLDQYL